VRQWIVLIAAVFTLDSQNSAQCDTACGYNGKDGGYFVAPDKCYCIEIYPFKELVKKKRMYLPKKIVRSDY